MSNLTLIGGEIALADLRDFLAEWHAALAFEYIIHETVDGINFLSQDQFNRDAVETMNLLRHNAFGEMGDLNLRRDSQRILWRYVGNPSFPTTFERRNYGTPLEKGTPVSSLLWGKALANGQHFEERVAKGKLAYPTVVDVDKKAVLKAYPVTDTTTAQVVAYWNFALDQYKGK
jgi:hypothetical protein